MGLVEKGQKLYLKSQKVKELKKKQKQGTGWEGFHTQYDLSAEKPTRWPCASVTTAWSTHRRDHWQGGSGRHGHVENAEQKISDSVLKHGLDIGAEWTNELRNRWWPLISLWWVSICCMWILYYYCIFYLSLKHITQLRLSRHSLVFWCGLEIQKYTRLVACQLIPAATWTSETTEYHCNYEPLACKTAKKTLYS